MRILIADDDPDLLEITGRLLKKQKYLVKTAINGQECLNSIRTDKPDLLLLDVMLPDMSGLEICKMIKSDPALSSIHVIMLSGLKTESESVSTGLEAGTDGYLLKPITNRELLARIHSAMRIIAAERSLSASKARTDDILAAITDIIMEVDADKVYTWANQAGYDFFGNDVIGKTADFFFEGEQDTFQLVQPLFNGSEDVITLQSWQRRKDGQKRLPDWVYPFPKDTWKCWVERSGWKVNRVKGPLSILPSRLG